MLGNTRSVSPQNYDLTTSLQLKEHGNEVTEDFPETDDSSESSSESIYEFKDFMFVVLSNCMFFIGSSCYVTTAHWDLKWYIGVQNSDDDYYKYYDFSIKHFEMSTYTAIVIFGATLLIFNATLDLTVCLNRAKSYEVSVFHRDIFSDILSAVAFGLAASIDFVTTFLTGNVVHLITTTSIVSAHIYLLSAIFSLWGTPLCKCYTSEGRLSLIGDWLFLVGSLIDVIISYISDPALIKVNDIILYRSSVFSSFLWLTDAGR